MDSNNFMKWLQEKLLPNIPKNSIVVMDNAPYHSKVTNKVPTTAARKEDIQKWLTENRIPFQEKMTKPELYYLLKIHKPAKIYFVDEMLSRNGHEVLRLPPYQCDLNPIEYIWNILKQRVADKNVLQMEKDIEGLTNDALNSITADDWKREINHVDRLREEYWKKDRLFDLREREMIIQVSEEESESESDSSSAISGIEFMDSD
ncbi:unnamed protein product [Euphydryas editha]|uniref:Tc1-like transposase DDE domain-containing protein n=1 Tax=Euphydryas editha TaxID=104508 RepID=A0AAU9U0M2_EUPED|nr:unnamed protein product [Euphydryas editha]